MSFDLENLEQSDPTSLLAGLECDLNEFDYGLTGHLGVQGLPAYASVRIADILELRALAAHALARVKDSLLSTGILFSAEGRPAGSAGVIAAARSQGHARMEELCLIDQK